MKIYPDLNKAMRGGRHLLKGTEPHNYNDYYLQTKERPFWKKALFLVFSVIILTIGGCIVGSKTAHAADNRPNTIKYAMMFKPNCFPVSGYTCASIVEAIGKAENSKTHPYGIMVKYRHTDPWQACMNTVKHAVMDFIKQDKERDFLHFLALRYAPIGADNDPNGLNANWERNVKAILKRDNAC